MLNHKGVEVPFRMPEHPRALRELDCEDARMQTVKVKIPRRGLNRLKVLRHVRESRSSIGTMRFSAIGALFYFMQTVYEPFILDEKKSLPHGILKQALRDAGLRVQKARVKGESKMPYRTWNSEMLHSKYADLLDDRHKTVQRLVALKANTNRFDFVAQANYEKLHYEIWSIELFILAYDAKAMTVQREVKPVKANGPSKADNERARKVKEAYAHNAYLHGASIEGEEYDVPKPMPFNKPMLVSLARLGLQRVLFHIQNNTLHV